MAKAPDRTEPFLRIRAPKWFASQPEFVRVGAVAALNTLIAYVTYETVHFLNPIEPRATTSWGIAFVIGVLRQHHLHRNLSFPSARVFYSVSLKREIVASVVLLIIGLILNYTLTARLGFGYRQAWAICLVSIAGLEYAAMKFFIFRAARKEVSH